MVHTHRTGWYLATVENQIGQTERCEVCDNGHRLMKKKICKINTTNNVLWNKSTHPTNTLLII